ncbi:MAG: prepilin-type N-terminal cleavage/methylation domain-containing protein [Acidobacteria bacterium]|nr:prepilin-type N-terminal cleavage/methylation domain-containing protein [Acidobacteriota bacterium]
MGGAITREQGFSLIELLIVVAIILIIAAIAIPNFLRARMAANEASAASALKLIGVANAGYLASYAQGYAGSLAQLGPPGAGCASVSSACADLLDSMLSGVSPASATPIKSGYRFTYYAENAVPTPSTPNNTYSVVATPITPGNTGQSTFCFDNTISIFKDAAGTLTTADERGCKFTWPVGGSVGPL